MRHQLSPKLDLSTDHERSTTVIDGGLLCRLNRTIFLTLCGPCFCDRANSLLYVRDRRHEMSSPCALLMFYVPVLRIYFHIEMGLLKTAGGALAAPRFCDWFFGPRNEAAVCTHKGQPRVYAFSRLVSSARRRFLFPAAGPPPTRANRTRSTALVSEPTWRVPGLRE